MTPGFIFTPLRYPSWTMRQLVARAVRVAFTAAIVAAPWTVTAADSVLGTLTVNGKTTTFKNVVATIEKDPANPEREYLVLLVSDVPIAPSDRAPARLLDLAKANRIRAVRILWLTMADWVRVVPYHVSIPESGRQALEHPTINLQAFDQRNVEIEFRSKMMGQSWHFNGTAKAAIQKKTTPIDLEPGPSEMAAPAEAGDTTPAGADPTSMKRRLGVLGYEYTPEMFTHAVKDGSLEAVQLFLKIGTPANAKDSQGNHMMVITAMMCMREPEAARLDIVKALLAAGANVNAADQNKSTALIWAAQSCSEEFVETLIKAGANVNARAAGGATPLMMATVMGRTEVADMLRKAGAKE